jgi:hypothetical protein
LAENSKQEGKIFDWSPRKSEALGDIHATTALVEVKASSGEWKIFYPLVDSGAFISVFNSCDCDLLGYELKNGFPIKINGALGGSYPAYVHKIDVKIGSDVIKSRIAFTEQKKHGQILGRADIFDYFRICFSGKSLKTTFFKE